MWINRQLSYTAEASTERCDAGESREYSLVRIRLLTGRHHQIRVQFSGHGTPLYGDDKYGEKTAPGQPDLLALCAFRLSFPHPVTGWSLKWSRPEALLSGLRKIHLKSEEKMVLLQNDAATIFCYNGLDRLKGR